MARPVQVPDYVPPGTTTPEDDFAKFDAMRAAPDPAADFAKFDALRASSVPVAPKPEDDFAKFDAMERGAQRPTTQPGEDPYPAGPETMEQQAARGFAPSPPVPDLGPYEAELAATLADYNRRTNHPDPEAAAVAQVEAMRRQPAQADRSAIATPFLSGEVAERVKAATEPGGIPYRAAEAIGPKWYGPAAQVERRHYWRVAENETDRQLGRVVLKQLLQDEGVPDEQAEIHAQAAYELGAPLPIPTADNPRFSAGPQVDVGVREVTKLDNTAGQAAADLASGTAEVATEIANLAKDIVVDAPLAVTSGIGGTAYEAVTGKTAPDPTKGLREWSIGSPTDALISVLPEGDLRRSLEATRERGAGVIAGGAELRNALAGSLGLDPMDPDGPTISEAILRLGLVQPKEEMPQPTPTGRDIAVSTTKRVAAVPGLITQAYADLMSGKRTADEVFADQSIAAMQLVSTPVMDVFSSVSKMPGGQERESSAGWFLRVPATAASGLVTTQAARIADYMLTRAGATSGRRNRVPGNPEMTAWEAFAPVIFTGSGVHDYLTTLYNGDSITSEWMRAADTASTLPGLTDDWRASFLPGGRSREVGTQLGMFLDFLLPLDEAPGAVVRGAGKVGEAVGDFGTGKRVGMSPYEAASYAGAGLAPSVTHALMLSDPEYKAIWEEMKGGDVDAQVQAGVAPQDAVRVLTPDEDAVRTATARAWARRHIARGGNPAAFVKDGPRDLTNLTNSVREQLTMLRVRPEEIEKAIRDLTDDAEPIPSSPLPEAVAAHADAAAAAAPDAPPLGAFTAAVTGTPRERIVAALPELAAHWGVDAKDPVVTAALQSALSYYNPSTKRYHRVGKVDDALLDRLSDADADRALSRLRDATPDQALSNAAVFTKGGTARWIDERIPDRSRVRSELLAHVVRGDLPLAAPDVDHFLTVTDHVADALVARGVLPDRDAWYARQTYATLTADDPDAARAFGFFRVAADGQAIIGLARDANLSTLFHENAHLLRSILPAEHMADVDAYVKEAFGGWDARAEEWFARQFESVLTTGKLSIVKRDTLTKAWADRLTAALRFAADTLRRIYESRALDPVHPVFSKWMETFAGLKLDIEPVKADAPPTRAPRPPRKGTVTADFSIPAPTRDGWSPALLAEAERRAKTAKTNKAVQDWLTWLHAYLGEPKSIRADRHRLAGRKPEAVVSAMLNAGRRIVEEMGADEKAKADAAFVAPAVEPEVVVATPATASALPEHPSKKELSSAGYKPEGKGMMVHPDTKDRYGWSYESKIWMHVPVEIPDGTKEEASATPSHQAAYQAVIASGTLKSFTGLLDAVGATPEERASWIRTVKRAAKDKQPISSVAEALIREKTAMPGEAPPLPPPTIPDDLAMLPDPEPTDLPVGMTMPRAGTLAYDAYGQPRRLVGNIPFTIRAVRLPRLVTEGVPAGIEELARTFNADEIDPTGVDSGVGAPTVVAQKDGTFLVLDGTRRTLALQELHRRGMAGEEPFRSVLAGVQARTSAWGVGLGTLTPLGDQVFVRDVSEATPAQIRAMGKVETEAAVGLDVLAALPPDLVDAAHRAGAPAQARLAAATEVIAAIVARMTTDPVFAATDPLGAIRDGFTLYGQVRSKEGMPARWPSQVRNRYVAVVGAKALPVSGPSVHVAAALGDLDPPAFAEWLDSVANTGTWSRGPADEAAVIDLPTRHDEAVEYARRLEMEAIEFAEAEKPVVTEPPGFLPTDDKGVLYQHRDYVESIAPPVKPNQPPPAVPLGDVVSEPVGRDQPMSFRGASPEKDGVATPYGMRNAKMRAIPAYTTPDQLLRALGYRSGQTRFNARDLAERTAAYALVQQSQAARGRSRYIRVGNTISVPANRAAAVRARGMLVLGDLPKVVKEAVQNRAALAKGADQETQPIGLSLAHAGRIRTLLNALDANGWIDSLPASTATMTVKDIAAKLTTEQYNEIVGAIMDSQSGAAPYRGRVDRYALAANLVWEFAQRPGGWFTPVPLDRDAPRLDKALNATRSMVGAGILNAAYYLLPSEAWQPDMRPDMRPRYEKMRREAAQIASRLAESFEAQLEGKHKPATPGAMQAEMEELARNLPGAVPPIGVTPRGDGQPSDLHRMRAWLYRDPPQVYGTTRRPVVDVNGQVTMETVFQPHDFSRVGDVTGTASPERPFTDPVAEVIAMEDVLNRVLNPPGMRMYGENVDLLNQLRNRTIDVEGAALLIGKSYAALNAARQIGIDVLVAAAGHTGSEEKVRKVVDAVEAAGGFTGIGLDAYDAFYGLRWSAPKGSPTHQKGAPAIADDTSIEALVRTLGVAPKTIPVPFWAFDVLNRLNLRHLQEQFTDNSIDHDYVFDLTRMAKHSAEVFPTLRDAGMFTEQVRRAINHEMWATNYYRQYGVSKSGIGEVGLDATGIPEKALFTARTIMAKMGIRPDVLATRRGFKGEMAANPTVSAWLSLPTDPVALGVALADPKTWRDAGKQFGLHGQDVYTSTVMAEHMAALAERHAPLAQRLAAVLSDRDAFGTFFNYVRDYFAQLKGSFITGGPNGLLASALVGKTLLGVAATAGIGAAIATVPGAVALGTAAMALTYAPRFAGFVNNTVGALAQGVLELGAAGTARALGTAGIPAARAAYQTVRFHRMSGAVDAALASVKALAGGTKGPENIVVSTVHGTVYTVADIMTISKRYGLDETQARSESAETIRRRMDRLYATYERDPSFLGGMWRQVERFFGRWTITENYRRLYEQVDVFFRYVWLIRGLQDGLRPEDAVARALRISFDYTATSELDRWINMVGLFWMYQRRAIDLTMAALVEHPHTVFGMVRFMRAQDLTSGYADTNEDYERETETTPEYAMIRPSLTMLPVAGTRNAAMKIMLTEPPQATAMRVFSDVTTDPVFAAMSRLNPAGTVLFNEVGTSAGGPIISMFRRTTADSPAMWKVPARFVMLDQALNGGALVRQFDILPMYVEDPQNRLAPDMYQEFYVGPNGRMAWETWRSLVPGFSGWLAAMDTSDRADDWTDRLTLEMLDLLTRADLGLAETQQPGSVFTPSVDVKPRPSLGQKYEALRYIGLPSAPIATEQAAEARGTVGAKTAMERKTQEKKDAIKRMNAPLPPAADIIDAEPIDPNKALGIEPDKSIGLER